MNAVAERFDYSTTDADCSSLQRPAPRGSIRPATDNVTRVFYPTPRMHVRWAIRACGRTYALRSTFVLDVEAQEEGGFFASHRTLPVSGYGDSQVAAIQDLCAAFDFQYRELVEGPAERLSAGALKERAAFKEVVAAVLPTEQR